MENKNNKILIYFFLTFTSVIIIRNAWVGDDSYIGFRTVYNFVNGYGLTFNINERVQAFTNPLWILVMSFFYFFTGEAYFTSIFVSLLLTILALYIIAEKLSKDNLMVITIFILALTSKAFIDYSTSGLENALGYLLLVLFSYVYLQKPSSNKKILLLSFIASLGAVNRLDNILLYSFPILFEFVKSFSLKTLGKIVLGFIPLIAWELFSIVYYGFPFPNTYYTKLNTGIPSHEYVEQGIRYVINSISLDPVTLLCALFVLLITGWQSYRLKKYILFPLALSIILYLIYTVKVGGDFMSGRFFTYPFVIALLLITQFDIPKEANYSIIGGCIIMSVFSIYSPILSGATYRESEKLGETLAANDGIADERAWYYPETGLLRLSHSLRIILFEESLNKISKQDSIIQYKETPVMLGFNTYEAGPNVYFFHHMALSDVLLARLPMNDRYNGNWRIGHYWRKIPNGYRETLQFNKNQIKDISLAKYYDKIKLIIRGKLFSWERFKTIYEMNTGKYNYLINPFLVAEASSNQKYNVNELSSFANATVPDANSFTGMARCVSPATVLTVNNISFGPYISLKHGKYNIDFNIKVDDNKDSLEVAYIDVFNNNIILAQKTLKANDFKEPMAYQIFTLNIAAETDLTNLEFRIFYKGNHTVCNDYIEVIPLK